MKKIISPAHEKLLVLLIFILSFAIRFLFLDETAASPLFAINALRGTDMEGYIRWGAMVSQGVYESGNAFWQAPLYPYFLGAVFKIAGLNIYIAALIQTILSSVSCVLIYYIAKEAFNVKTAAASGLIACFYAPFIFYCPVLLSETLGVFLLLAALLPIVKSVYRPEPKHALAGGALLGLAALARPNFLLFVPFFTLYIFLMTKNIKKFCRYLIPFAGALIVVILPVTVRNYAVSGRFVLISDNFGETFRLSNSFDSLVLNYTEPRGPQMPVGSVAFWRHQAKKALYFWWGMEVPQNVNYYLFAESSRILKLPLIPFWLLFPPGIAGLCLWYKSEYRNNKTLAIFITAYYASIVMLYIISRFRVPFAAAFIPFSAFGLIRISEFVKDKKPAAIPLILLCVMLSAASYPRGAVRIRGTDYRMLGIAMVQEGMYAEAVEPLRKSLDLLPPAERESTRELIYQLEEMSR